MNNRTLLLGAMVMLACQPVSAQLTLTGQLRTRTELRAGQGTLQQKGDVPGLLTSQRTRFNVGYGGARYKVYSSVQDVRVWGQDASSINRYTTEANNGIMFHEAWGEILLTDTSSWIKNVTLKIGRQEIGYDDARLLGNLDWLQQARRHDAAVLKFSNKGWTVDAGVAYNQNKELAANNIYNGVPGSASVNGSSVSSAAYPAGTNGIGAMYKSMQYLYVSGKFGFGKSSFLFFRDNFNKYAKPSKTPVRGEWDRITTGFFLNANVSQKILLTGSVYYQGGSDKNGAKLSAGMASLLASCTLSNKVLTGLGIDYLSGNDGTKVLKANSTNNRFDPLYGTPHKFYGYMDYFYVANGFGEGGLVDYYFKSKVTIKDNFFFTLDVHGFTAANNLSDGKGGALDPYLGTEIDLVFNYNLTKQIKFESGYSTMFAGSSMASKSVKGVGGNPNPNAHWVYIMIAIQPDFLGK